MHFFIPDALLPVFIFLLYICPIFRIPIMHSKNIFLPQKYRNFKKDFFFLKESFIFKKNSVMKKIFITLTLTFITFLNYAQQWNATNAIPVSYLPISGLESFKGDLYTIYFDSYYGYLRKFDKNTSTWSTVKTDPVLTPRFIKSAETRFYVSSVISNFYSKLYYNKSGTDSLILDTAGIPAYQDGVALIYGLNYHDGKILVNLGAGGYYGKDTSETKFRSINVTSALNGGVDPIDFYLDTFIAFDNTGTKTFYRSVDDGKTFNAITTNLPVDFGANILYVDQTTKRFYACGSENNNTVAVIYFSDDRGFNWTKMPLSDFMKKDAENNPQLATAIYAKGNNIYIGLKNDKPSSSPDIIHSSTGINGFAYDTLGLPTNASYGVHCTGFMEHESTVYARLVTTDVYRYGLSTSIKSYSNKNETLIIPNPFKDYITIENPNDVKSLYIYSIEGKLMQEIGNPKSRIDLSYLETGLYLVKIVLQDHSTANFKIKKF